MKGKSQQELLDLLVRLQQNTLSSREIYHAIQSFGEMNFQEARPEVERFLTSTDPDLRGVALKVLTLYWRLPDHWNTARDMLEQDPNTNCRIKGAAALGDLMMNTQDTPTLHVLARVVINEEERRVVRETAYAAMRSIIRHDPREQFHFAARSLDLAKDIDWDLVKHYL